MKAINKFKTFVNTYYTKTERYIILAGLTLAVSYFITCLIIK